MNAAPVPLTGVRDTFVVGGLLALGACAVLIGERLLPPSARAAREARPAPST